MKQEQARQELLKLWRALPTKKKTEQHMFNFWSKLHLEHHKAAHFKCVGDQWQKVKGWLLKAMREDRS